MTQNHHTTLEGLTTTQAATRLAQDGPNEIAQTPRRSLARRLLDMLRQPMFALLVAAAALYMALGDLTEGLTLGVFVLAVLVLTSLAGCGTPAPTTHGTTQHAPLSLAHVAQSDVNRMASLAMRDNLQSLLRIADKLYQRNPAEWQKTSAISREDALAQIKTAIDTQTPWPGLRDGEVRGARSVGHGLVEPLRAQLLPQGGFGQFVVRMGRCHSGLRLSAVKLFGIAL